MQPSAPSAPHVLLNTATVLAQVINVFSETQVDEDLHGSSPEQVSGWRTAVSVEAESFLQSPRFSLFRNRTGSVNSQSAKRIVHRSFLFYSEVARAALRLYSDGIVSDVRGFLIERTTQKHLLKHRAPLDVVVLDRRFASWMSNDELFEFGKVKLRQRAFPKESYTFQIGQDGRGFLLALVIHISSFLGLLLQKATELQHDAAEVGDEPDGDVILSSVSPRYVGERMEDVSYPTPIHHLDWFREKIWPYVHETVISFAKDAVHDKMEAARDHQTEDCWKAAVSDRRLLKAKHMVSSKDLFTTFMSGDDTSSRLGADILAMCATISSSFTSLTESTFYDGEIPEATQTALSHFFRQIRNAVSSTTPDITRTTRRNMLGEEQWFAKIMAKFNTLRSVLRSDNRAEDPIAVEVLTSFPSTGALPTIAVPSGGPAEGNVTGTGAGHMTATVATTVPTASEDHPSVCPTCMRVWPDVPAPEGAEDPEIETTGEGSEPTGQVEDEIQADTEAENADEIVPNPRPTKVPRSATATDVSSPQTNQPTAPKYVFHPHRRRPTGNEGDVVIRPTPQTPSFLPIGAVHSSHPAIVEGSVLLSLTLGRVLDRWVERQEFTVGKTLSSRLWVERRVTFVSKQDQPTTDVIPTGYRSMHEYVSTWKAIGIMNLYSHLSDLAKKFPSMTMLSSPSSVLLQTVLNPLPGVTSLLYLVTGTARNREDGFLTEIMVERNTTGSGNVRRWDVAIVERFAHVEDDSIEYCGAILGIVGCARSERSGGMFHQFASVQCVGELTHVEHAPIPSGREYVRLTVVDYLAVTIRASTVIDSLVRPPPQLASLVTGCGAPDFTEASVGKQLLTEKSGVLDRDWLESVTRFGGCDSRCADYVEANTQLSSDPSSTSSQQSHNIRSLSAMNAKQAGVVSETLRLRHDPDQGPKEPSRHRTLCVVGPAGTGKTNTLMHTIAAFLNSRQVRERVLRYEEIRRSAVERGGEGRPQDAEKCGEKSPGTAQRILVLAPTHAALDVIELKLQEGVDIVDTLSNGTDGSAKMKSVKPSYNRVVRNTLERGSLDGDMAKKNMEKLYPPSFHNRNDASITLCTLNSLWVLVGTNAIAEKSVDGFDLIVLDEAAQASEADCMDLLYLIGLMWKRGRNCILTLFGDNMQQGPFTKGEKTYLTELSKLSLFERLIPSTSDRACGLDVVDHILLDRQFRMHPTISALSNAVAHREVEDGVSYDRGWLSNYSSKRALLLDDPIQELKGVDLKRPVVWYDPYKRESNMEYAMHVRSTVRTDVGGVNCSEVEAVAICHILKKLWSMEGFKEEEVCIVTPYVDQKKLLKSIMKDMLSEECNNKPLNIIVTTVATVQGKDFPVVIYSPVRNGRRGRGTPGSNALFASRELLYVSITRAKQHFYVVGDDAFLRNASPAWTDACERISNP